MRSRVREHVRRNAVAYLALFVALGGTSYAATKIGSDQIKDNAILSRHIKDGNVRRSDLDQGLVTRSFSFQHTNTDAASTRHPVLTVGGMQLEATCDKDIGFVALHVFVKNLGKSPAAFNAGWILEGDSIPPSSSSHQSYPFTDGSLLSPEGEASLDQSPSLSTGGAIVAAGGDGPAYTRAEGQIIFSAGAKRVTINFHALTTTQGLSCRLLGSAYQAQ